MDNLSTHVKHVLIAVGCFIVLVVCVKAYTEMKVKLATIDSATQEKIKASQVVEKAATQTITTAVSSNSAIDVETKQKLDQIQKQLASKPNSNQVLDMVNAAIPGLQGLSNTSTAAGVNLISVPDTQENRDAINKTDADFKACRFNYDDCEKKQANYIIIIDQKDKIIAAKQAVIDQNNLDIKHLKSFGQGGNFWARTGRVAITSACAAAGAGLAAEGGLKPKGIAIAGLLSAGTCAITLRF